MRTGTVKANMFYNMINQSCIFLFQIATFPYATRILHTTNYGRVSFCLSILNYFLLLAQLGLSSYVIREGAAIREDHSKVEKLISEIFTINFLSTLVSLALYVISIFIWWKLRINMSILLVLGVQLLLNLFNVEWINNIFEDFKYIAIRNSIIQLLSIGFLLILVRQENDYVFYALIIAISASLNYVINFFHCKKSIKLRLEISPALKPHIAPIMVLFFNALAVVIYVNSDVTILGLLQSDNEVGLYSVSVRVYTVVKKVFQAVVIVSIPRLSNYLASGQIDRYKTLLKKMHDSVLTIVFPMLVGLILVSKNAVLIVGGAEYLDATASLQILCFALLFSSLANFYISCVLLPQKKEKIILISTVISSIVNVVLNLILIPVLSLNGAAVTTVIAEIVVMMLAIYASGEFRQFNRVLPIYVQTSVGCIGVIIVCLWLDRYQLNLVYDTILKIGLSIVVYSLIEFLLRNPLVLDVVKRRE